MEEKNRHIVVIGTSAGGSEALEKVICQLPASLPASIFIVQHLGAEASAEALRNRLGKHKAVICKLAVNGVQRLLKSI